MSGRDIALTGIPRGGTTLACRLLGLAADTVALFEPMDVAALPPDREGALVAIGQFFEQTRQRLLGDGTAPSKLEDGRVPDNPFSQRDADGHRRNRIAQGELHLDKLPPSGFTLVVKHNAAFTALLPELAEGRHTLAVVRNPLAVLASWNSLQLPVSAGRLPAAERLEPSLASRLAEAPDRLSRQVLILQWCFERFASALPGANVLRYEDMVGSQGQTLFGAAGVRGVADRPLQVRNDSPAYRGFAADVAMQRLRAAGGAWSRWYPRDEIAALGMRLSALEDRA